MHYRQRQAMNKRQRGGGREAREVDFPIPLQGLFVDAKSADVSGLYAAKLNNFRTDGVLIETRRQSVLGAADQLVLQRIPFQFGASPRYIDLRADQAECAGQIFARAFNGKAMAAYMSSQAIIADGLDDPIRYDGTGFATAVFTTTTGVSPASFDGCIAHQDRLFFWRTNGTLEFYYGDVGAVMGALDLFPLDRLGNIEGSILSMISLTQDAGANSNDTLAIMTTTGDVVTYTGQDPGDSNNWSIGGRFKSAPPLSRFGMTRAGSDIWMMTALGVVSIADSISQGALSLVSEISAPISDEILDLALADPDAEWQMHAAADGSMIIINYFNASVQRQFIWNVKSRAWATADLPARRWHNLALKTEYTNGIGQLGTFVEDKNGSEVITATWHSSWFKIGGKGRIAYIVPNIIAKGQLVVKVAVLSDRNETASDVLESEQVVTLVPDNPADPGGTVILDGEIGIGAVGKSFQLRIEVTATWAQIVGMRAGIA